MLPGLMKDLAKFFAMLLNSFSLGLGEINLHSALNQSLDAEIGLLSVGNTDAEEIIVKLASRDDFEKAGLERPFFLTKFKFQVSKRSNGQPYLKITSQEPVKEPFLDFIIEANWPGGRILREYTLLLDPPVLVDERPAALDIPLFDNELSSEGDDISQQGASTTTGRVNRAASKREAPRFLPRTSEVSIAESGEISYGPVKRTDTLWRIASQMKPDNSVTVQQVMIALLNENPEAFDNQNINDLKAGYFLRISDPAVISAVSSNEAERIATLQYEQWVDAKHSTALAAGQRPLGTTETVAGADSRDEIEPRLKLVAPDEGMSQAGSGSTLGADEEDVRQELAFALESVDVSRQENEELRQRLSALEEQLASMQRLITLKGDTLSAMQVSPEELATAEVLPSGSEMMPDEAEVVDEPLDSMMAASDAQQNEPDVAAPPVVTPPPVVVPPPVEASIVDEALAVVDGLLGDAGSMLGGIDPMIPLGGLAAVGLLVGGLVMRRRKQTAFEEEMSDDEVNINYAEPEVGQAEAVSDEAVESVLNDVIPEYSNSGGMDVSDDDEIDAIAEADVYLAYRRFDKAEELLSEAVQNEPDRHDIQVKLLEVYAASDKKDAFIEQAEKLRSSLGGTDSSIWKNIVEMGRKIAPTNLLFNDESDAVVDSTGASNEMDIDLPDLGGDLDLGDLDMGGSESSSNPVEPVSESDNPFADVNVDEMDALDDDGLSDAFGTLDDLGELEASLDSAMDMVSDVDSDALPDLEVTEAKKDTASLDDISNEISFENEFELDAVADVELDDSQELLGTSDELAFEESVDESGIGGDGASSDDNTLDLDDIATTASPEKDVLASGDELAFDTESLPESDGNNEDLSAGLIFEDDDSALDSVIAESGVSEAQTVSESMGDADNAAINDIEEDLFAGLDDISGNEPASGDDWLSDLSDDISSLDDDLGDLDDSELFSAEDEVGTKLDLARAYIDMGDNESAKGILDEVVNDGNDDQKKDANELIERIA